MRPFPPGQDTRHPDLEDEDHAYAGVEAPEVGRHGR